MFVQQSIVDLSVIDRLSRDFGLDCTLVPQRIRGELGKLEEKLRRVYGMDGKGQG